MADNPLDLIAREAGAAVGRLEKEIRAAADVMKAEQAAGLERLARELSDARLAVSLAVQELNRKADERIAAIQDGKDGERGEKGEQGPPGEPPECPADVAELVQRALVLAQLPPVEPQSAPAPKTAMRFVKQPDGSILSEPVEA